MTTDSGSGGRRLVLDEAVLRSQLMEIKAERARLDARERAVLGALDLFENGIGKVDEDVAPKASAPAAIPPSQKKMLRAVLATARVDGGELSVSEMIALIMERFGVELPRTSVSPTLAKMEVAGEVEHVGRKWRLPDEGLFERGGGDVGRNCSV